VDITEEQREAFLKHVREGKNRQQAAEEIGETATRFRNLCRRDPVFNVAYEDAAREGKGSLVDRLERCAVEMAQEGHWPALKFLITTYGDQFAWARSSKVEVGGQVEITAVAGILSRYLPTEMYDELIQTVEQKMLEDGERTAA
jgi:hypothetical protein